MARKATGARGSKAGAAWTADAAQRIVVLAGGDDFLRSQRTREIRAALEAAFGTIAESRFSGATAAIADVLDACRGFSLLGEHNLAIVDDAEELLKASEGAPASPRSSTRGKPADYSSPRRIIERYAATPAEHATLVLRAQVWRPGNLDKLIAKVGAVVKCDAPTPDRAIAWVQRLCQERLDRSITEQASAALVRRLGPDLGALHAELQKLAAVAEGGEISRELIDQFVARSRDEEAWAIQEALLAGGAGAALSELDAICGSFPRESDAIVPAAWAVADLARKLHTAARLLERGASPFDAAKSAGAWGSTREAILRVARQCQAVQLADLLEDAVETNAAAKGGVDPRRALETLLVRFSEAIGSGAGGARTTGPR